MVFAISMDKKNFDPSIILENHQITESVNNYSEYYLIIFTSMKMPIEAVIELLKNIIRRVFDEKLV